MTLDDVKEYYGFENDRDVARIFGIEPPAVSKWRNTGIPDGRQAMLELASRGALKSDEHVLANLKTLRKARRKKTH